MPRTQPGYERSVHRRDQRFKIRNLGISDRVIRIPKKAPESSIADIILSGEQLPVSNDIRDAMEYRQILVRRERRGPEHRPPSSGVERDPAGPSTQTFEVSGSKSHSQYLGPEALSFGYLDPLGEGERGRERERE